MRRTGCWLLSLCLLSGFIGQTGFATAASDARQSPSPEASAYARWKNGPSSDPNYFPLAVWLQSPGHIGEFRDIGINTFVGHWGTLSDVELRLFAESGMALIVGQSAAAIAAADSSAITAWLQPDEPDNAQSDGHGGYGPCIPPAVLKSNYARYRANDPSRPVLLGFGRGVSDTHWVGRGSCTGNTSYYVEAAGAGDILTFDIYPVANETGRLDDPARGVKNLIRWSGGSKIVWNDIEASAINGGAVPTAAQVRSEVWMSIIAGSRGIVYFVHEFSPRFREDGIFNHPDLVRGVKALNEEIRALAPVLNAPAVKEELRVSASPSSVPIGVMAKKWDGATYIFAAAMADTPAQVDFKLPALDQGVVEVTGEHRKIPLSGGIFRDGFRPYDVHIYRIAEDDPR
ncbi:MAG: hypothetical protein ACTHJ3_12030 [Pararhizobium sp.]